jgi:threonine synthase
MKYISTRGGDSAGGFREVIMKGLAADGGLFVPETYPVFSAAQIASFKSMSYAELAFEVISPYVGEDIPAADLRKILGEVYNSQVFRDAKIAPLTDLGFDQHVLELFHGPTLAFKDFALQLLGKFFNYFLAKTDHKINIIGATSGDTGSAAIAGCAGMSNVNVFILHPKGRVSDVQRKQMTTILADNVFNIALEGSFDDCQNIVKELFEDAPFKKSHTLSAVNSINWGRIVAQVVYYFYAALQLGAPERKVSFSVPTGNFGDILAGWIASKMGLPIEKLVIATNQNDILHRFMETGIYKKEATFHTISPSMDIQISSNFERLLFEYHGRDAKLIAGKIAELKSKGEFSVEPQVLNEIRKTFSSARVDDVETSRLIREINDENEYVLDPHSAIGVRAAQMHKGNAPMVALATAHPAKFPAAVQAACCVDPELPVHLADLFTREERMSELPNSAAAVKEFVVANS